MNERGESGLIFDPFYRLTDVSHGFRIFASEDYLRTLPAKRYNTEPLPLPPQDHWLIYLNALVKDSGQSNAEIYTRIAVENSVKIDSLCIKPTFIDYDPPPSFHTALLAGLLYALQDTPKSVPITILSSTNFLGSAFVTKRTVMENNPLHPNFRLIKCIIAYLNERAGRVIFTRRKLPPVSFEILHPHC
ncbi:hypothetical protein R3P38DRAFT_3230011 [Favolaschia claudopus]|uniref:Uncharacterized protein n=1 Tax=Favolaschia claudopus TaxID=2862362 RepID=A0AAV9ZNA1_9AGAR